jgi:hypothetical protein
MHVRRSAMRKLFDLREVHDVVCVVESLDDAMAHQRSVPVMRHAFLRK